MPTADDMDIDGAYDRSLLGVQERYHVSYVMEVSKMAVIRKSTDTYTVRNSQQLTVAVGRIISGEFSPRRDLIPGYNPMAVVQELSKWEAELPPELRRTQGGAGRGQDFWSCMLHAFYKLALLFYVTACSDKLPATVRCSYAAPNPPIQKRKPKRKGTFPLEWQLTRRPELRKTF